MKGVQQQQKKKNKQTKARKLSVHIQMHHLIFPQENDNNQIGSKGRL
jgi:hypothetical protein